MKKRIFIISVCLALVGVCLSFSVMLRKDNRLSMDIVNSTFANIEFNENSWNLFVEYEHKDIGSGTYIFQFPLKEGGYLYILGPSLKETPWEIYFSDEKNTYKDIYHKEQDTFFRNSKHRTRITIDYIHLEG